MDGIVKRPGFYSRHSSEAYWWDDHPPSEHGFWTELATEKSGLPFLQVTIGTGNGVWAARFCMQ